MDVNSKVIEDFLKCKSRSDLARVLGVDVQALTYFAYGNGKRYSQFTIPKRSGGERVIDAPIDGLKFLQKKLALILAEIYPSPICATAFIHNKSIVDNASFHVGRNCVLNFDIKDFFPSITAFRVIGLFKSKPFHFNNEVASTLAGLTCYEKRLPQGAPSSPVISNMICYRLDRDFRSLAKSYRVSYSRYADDITFSTRKRDLPSVICNSSIIAPRLGDEILRILKDNFFELNDKKTRLHRGRISKFVTGVKVNTSPNVSKLYIREIKSMLHACEKFNVKNAQKHFSNKYGGGNKNLLNVLKGKIAHVKNIKGGNDLAYARLYNRYIEIEGKGRSRLPETNEQVLQKKVFVIRSNDGRVGTGFILDSKYLVSCWHVVADSISIRYHHYNMLVAVEWGGSRFISDFSSKDRDISLMAPRGKDCSVDISLTLARSDVSQGDSFQAVGFPNYPGGYLDIIAPSITPVVVTKLQRDSQSGIYWAHVDSKLVAGTSGGPVLNSRKDVAGIVVRGAPSYAGTDDYSGYIFLPVQEIRKFIAEIEEKG